MYPDVPLKLARTRRDEARKLVADGVDPRAEEKATKEARQVTYKWIADDWLALQAKTLATITHNKARWMRTEFIYPSLGSRPIAALRGALVPVITKNQLRSLPQ